MPTNTTATPKQKSFSRLPAVRKKAGNVASSTIWGWVKKGTFPKPIKLSENCTAWDDDDLEQWAQPTTPRSVARALNFPASLHEPRANRKRLMVKPCFLAEP